jgi:hypothetical protein
MHERTLALVTINLEVTQRDTDTPHVSADIFTPDNKRVFEFESTPEKIASFLEEIKALFPKP